MMTWGYPHDYGNPHVIGFNIKFNQQNRDLSNIFGDDFCHCCGIDGLFSSMTYLLRIVIVNGKLCAKITRGQPTK